MLPGLQGSPRGARAGAGTPILQGDAGCERQSNRPARATVSAKRSQVWAWAHVLTKMGRCVTLADGFTSPYCLLIGEPGTIVRARASEDGRVARARARVCGDSGLGRGGP